MGDFGCLDVTAMRNGRDSTIVLKICNVMSYSYSAGIPSQQPLMPMVPATFTRKD